MRHLGAPILGDSRYARKDPLFAEATLMLHARALGIKLPGNDSLRTFTAPLPQRFREVIRSLQSSSPRKGL
jgi:23S rRNA pseudouridine1911/1915/1917 synthase